MQNIEGVINKFKTIPENLAWSKNLRNELVDATKGYSTEVLKLAIAQTTLDETQIKAILTAKGLKGEILETTTAELAQATATNALSASEIKATATTGGLSAAFKGLGASIKSFVSANPFVFLTAGAIALGVAMSKIADRVYNTEKYAKKALDKSAEKVDNVKSEIDSLNSELQTTQNRIDELNAKENLTLVEREELDRLKERRK